MFIWNKDINNNFVSYVNMRNKKAYLKVTANGEYFGYKFKYNTPYKKIDVKSTLILIFEGKESSIELAKKTCERRYKIWAGIINNDKVAVKKDNNVNNLVSVKSSVVQTNEQRESVQGDNTGSISEETIKTPEEIVESAELGDEEVKLEAHRENGVVTITCDDERAEIRYLISTSKNATINSNLYTNPIETELRVSAIALINRKKVAEVEV